MANITYFTLNLTYKFLSLYSPDEKYFLLIITKVKCYIYICVCVMRFHLEKLNIVFTCISFNIEKPKRLWVHVFVRN